VAVALGLVSESASSAQQPVEASDLCEHWPVQFTISHPYAQNIKGLPSKMVVSVTRDPATLHKGGISLAKSLGASLLTF
jgi:hypothetical protein